MVSGLSSNDKFALVHSIFKNCFYYCSLLWRFCHITGLHKEHMRVDKMVKTRERKEKHS